MSWTNGPRVGFDTETTGVDVTTDRIVTAALVYREPGEEDKVMSWIINPGVPIPENASNVHKITDEYAQEHGAEPKEALEDMSSRIVEYLLSEVPIVAYNATYDVSILENELKRYGLPTVRERIEGNWTVIDPLVLDRALDKWRKGGRKLIDNLKEHGVANWGNLHTAEDDVIATLDLLDKMIIRHPKLKNMPLQQLQNFQTMAHRTWAKGFNSYLERQGKVADVNETWLGKND